MRIELRRNPNVRCYDCGKKVGITGHFPIDIDPGCNPAEDGDAQCDKCYLAELADIKEEV